MTNDKRKEIDEKAQLALNAMRRGVRLAFLNGTAYDPDGSGKAYWQACDESGKLIEVKKTA